MQKKKEDGTATTYILGQLIMLEARHHKIQKIQKKNKYWLKEIVEEEVVEEDASEVEEDDDEGVEAGVDVDVNDEGEELPADDDDDRFEEEEEVAEEENFDDDVFNNFFE